MEFLTFQFVPIVSCPVTEHHKEEFDSVLLTPPIRYLPTLLRPLLSFLFSRLNSPSSYKRCSSPLTISVSFCWTHSSKSTSPLHWGAENWTQYLSWVSPGLSRGEDHLPTVCQQCSSQCSPGGCWPPLPQRHTAGTWSACCPPGPPGPSLQSCFPDGRPHPVWVCGVIPPPGAH